MANFIYVATCLFGLERLVGEEIDELGYKRIDTIDEECIENASISLNGDVSNVTSKKTVKKRKFPTVKRNKNN